MCLIAFAWRVHPHYPLIVAANRDEFHARPTAALARWVENPEVIGGRDLQAGGSWMGARRGGRFAAVTNYRTPQAGAGERSRGALVRDFLLGASGTPSAAARLMCDAERYGPFNLLLADGAELVWATNRPTPAWRSVPAGVHGISNGAPSFGDARAWPKVARLVAALEAWVVAPAADAVVSGCGALFAALADERPATDAELPDTGVGLAAERRLSPVFVRGPRYGTRCSSVVLIGADGAVAFQERRFGANGLPVGETRLELAPA